MVVTDAVMKTAALCGVDAVIAQLLAERGITDPEQARQFLYSDCRRVHDPFLLPDMDRAVARINAAVGAGERILVLGDSDVDGITAAASLTDFLRARGADASYLIPDSGENNRFWSDSATSLPQGTRLIITVDMGVSSPESIAVFCECGVDVVVTDHHECKTLLPDCCAVVDPCRSDSRYPFPMLSGAGVALKLICALAGQDAPAAFAEYCDLVALGTVADAMPMLDENRYIVKCGLEKINSRRRIGLDALLRTAGYNFDRPVTASSAGFVIAPRINAVGRIGKAGAAVELLLSGSFQQAKKLADVLAAANRERQQLESTALRSAGALLEEQFDPANDRAIVLKVKNWHPGMSGIVASRLMDRHRLPCIVVSFADGVGRGSARSLRGFDVYAAFAGCADMLVEYGGHELAAGLTVREENFPALKSALLAAAARAAESGGAMPATPAAEIDTDRLTLAFARALSLLEPFGIGNPQPVFLVRDMHIDEITSLANDRHLRVTLSKNGSRYTGLVFGRTVRELECATGDTADVSLALDINIVRGAPSLQLIIKHLELAASCTADGFEAEYRAFAAGGQQPLPEGAAPERADVIDVYSYLLRASCSGTGKLVYNPRCLARVVSRTYDRQINYAKLMLSLDVLAQLGMAEYTFQGANIAVTSRCLAHKTNLSDSPLWRRIRS